ncbi:MAG: Hpt domain-containing protein [Paracoccaceae bacterium]|nr:Hpt domain-containing protein [Paracoccaceae bacterium]
MIDWNRALELRAEIGAEDFDEVVELFLTEVEGTLDQLDDGLANARVMEEQMHFLKGAALNLGFSAVSTLCQSGEAAAAAGKTDAVAPDEVRAVYAQSKTQFFAELAQRAA